MLALRSLLGILSLPTSNISQFIFVFITCKYSNFREFSSPWFMSLTSEVLGLTVLICARIKHFFIISLDSLLYWLSTSFVLLKQNNLAMDLHFQVNVKLL